MLKYPHKNVILEKSQSALKSGKHTWTGSVGLGGGNWFGSDPLSKRILRYRPDPLSKSIFVS